MPNVDITNTMLAALRAEGMTEIQAIAVLARFWSMVRNREVMNARPEYPAFK